MSLVNINSGFNAFVLADGAQMRNYQNNPNLKAEGVKLQFTPEQIAERIRCASDPIYFMEKYIKIVHVDRGLVPFTMYDFQKQLVQSYIDNRYTIGKLPRQVGKSTVTVAFILWTILFGPMQSIAILANKASTAKDILSKLQLAYEHIPLWMQQGIKAWNKGSIELENGSKVKATSTASSSARGGTYNLIFLDEFAFVPTNIAEDFFTSVFPTISSGKSTKVVMISTPNGMNLFYKFWMDAHKKGKDWNGFHAIEAHWSVVPGRDQAWYEEQIRVLGEEKFNQEYGCEFLGSANTLISGAKLGAMPWKDPMLKHGCVDVYEKPQPGHLYIIPVDTARGTNLDYSAFTVIDATTAPYRVVAKYRSNKIDSYNYPSVIHNVATIYNNAHLLVEINDVGKQVADILHNDLEYEHIFSTLNMGRGGQRLSGGFKKGAKLGVATSEPMRKIGCSNLKALVESDQLLVEDFDIIKEFTTFSLKNGKYQAEEGEHDDLVMCLVLFGWLTTQPLFKDLTDLDIRKRMEEEKIAIASESVLPFGIVSTGQEKVVEVDDQGDAWEDAPDWLKQQVRFFNDIHHAMGDSLEDDDDDGYSGNSL